MANRNQRIGIANLPDVYARVRVANHLRAEIAILRGEAACPKVTGLGDVRVTIDDPFRHFLFP
jgi:hypothetical protein